MKAGFSNKLFDFLIIFTVILAVIICIIPILNVAARSMSSNSAIINSKVTLFPVEPTLQSYESIIKDKSMITSLFYTLKVTVIYTFLSMLLTVLAAYPLTKKRLKGRNFFLLVILITMYFSGGMIPDYILMKTLKLTNSMWVLILPGLISAYNMIILKTFFSSLPESLEESAILDGCTQIGVLFRIVIPLSTPVLATLSLFYAVFRWNAFTDSLMYVTKPELYPLQQKLYQVVVNSQSLEIIANEGSGNTSAVLPESLKSACVIFATIPILLVYPWLQKYFVKGVMIGAVKG